MWWIAPFVVAAGAAALLAMGRRRVTPGTRNPVVAMNLRYQPAAFAVAIAAVALVRVLVPDHADYLAWGDWERPSDRPGHSGRR